MVSDSARGAVSRGAELLAKDRIKHPGSRQNFLSLVRNSLADHIGRGEKLPPAMLRTDRTREPRGPDREPPLTR